MTSSTPSTGRSVSPDSGEHWTAEGAWPVADGIHRIPLPLPMDGLRAVNVYVIEGPDGLTLIDGGWAIDVAREVFERSLRDIGAGFGDIRRFLVTHVHRDHYTMASVLGEEHGAEVSLGIGEKPALDVLNDPELSEAEGFLTALVAAGEIELAAAWRPEGGTPEPRMWRRPDVWLEGDLTIPVGGRTLDAVHTPGHTPGHYVFVEPGAELLFAGDHVLPTITPSIGFTVPPEEDPLSDFMASLTRVRSLPDVRVLPAHGPVAPSSHARVDELLAHHEERLAHSLEACGQRTVTSLDVARQLGWTRHGHSYDVLDDFNRGLAVMETKAHLELLVARGELTRERTSDGVVEFTRVAPQG